MPLPNLDVLCFGEVIVDFFPETPGVPLRDVERFTKHAGGAPANVATALARLGKKAGLCTLVGDDEFGHFLRARLEAEGVDTGALGTHPTARTGITFVAVGPKGERTFSFFRQEAADQLVGPEHIDPAQIARARVFHFGSSTLSREPCRAATYKALDAAQAAGAIVSCDPNFRLHLWKDPEEARRLTAEALARTELAKLSDDELPGLVGTPHDDVQAGARAVRKLGPAQVVVTLGAKGAWYSGPDGEGHVAGEDVRVVDTTGAGDGFVAGLLAHLAPAFAEGQRPKDLSALDMIRACSYANRVAARVVTRLGATASLPRADELLP